MRDIATRTVPPAMPNSAAEPTRARVGRRGGCTPSSVLATTERAVRRRVGVLRLAGTCGYIRNMRGVATTMLPPDAALPDVLPTDRLTRSGMAVPAVREDLRRIANVRNVAVGRRALGGHHRPHRRDRVERQPLRVRGDLRAHGPDVRPVRDPRPRGRAPAAVLVEALERPRGPLAPRLSGVRAVRGLPALPLRPPQGRVRSPRARPRPVQRLSGHPVVVAPQAAARRGRHLGVEEPQAAAAGDDVEDRPPVRQPHRRRPGRAAGSGPGCSPAAGGCTRCSGSAPG